MCKDNKCGEGKKCCSFWGKMFGCKCKKEGTCCGTEKKAETPVQNPVQSEPTKEETTM